MSTPDVSVVIPTRDRLPLLAQTLHSVLDQQVDLEVVVVDDASTDGTRQWLEQHPDPRVRTMRHTAPTDVAQARNAGTAASRGRWLAFVDDDDLWAPDKLALQLAAARAQDAAWAFGGAVTFRDGPTLLNVAIPDPDDVDELPRKNTVPGGGSNVVVAREALEEVGGFDPSISIVADWDMWLRLHTVGEPAVVPQLLVGYRVHATNMSGDVNRMLDGVRAIEDRYRHLRNGDPVDWPLFYRWLEQNAMRAGQRLAAVQLALRALRAGHPRARRRLLRTLVPLRQRDPVAHPSEATLLIDRFRRRPVLPWPEDSRDWLSRPLQVTP